VDADVIGRRQVGAMAHPRGLIGSPFARHRPFRRSVRRLDCRRTDMNPDDPESAQRIVAEYAHVLERGDPDAYPASIRTLPYPKQMIKSAILTCAATLRQTQELTDDMREFLEQAYVALADYVDDDLVHVMAEYRDALAAIAEVQAARARLLKARVLQFGIAQNVAFGHEKHVVRPKLMPTFNGLADTVPTFQRRLVPCQKHVAANQELADGSRQGRKTTSAGLDTADPVRGPGTLRYRFHSVRGRHRARCFRVVIKKRRGGRAERTRTGEDPS
jgi:hypothetical protein